MEKILPRLPETVHVYGRHCKGVTKIGEFSKALGQSSNSRLMELRTALRSSIKKVRTVTGERVANVKQSAEAFANRLSQGGMQPAMAGGHGSSTGAE